MALREQALHAALAAESQPQKQSQRVTGGAVYQLQLGNEHSQQQQQHHYQHHQHQQHHQQHQQHQQLHNLHNFQHQQQQQQQNAFNFQGFDVQPSPFDPLFQTAGSVFGQNPDLPMEDAGLSFLS
jgi:hypothetical protein